MSQIMANARFAQRGAVTLIAVILMITVITFAALTAGLYVNSNMSDTLQQDDSVAALFLAESGLEAGVKNYAVSGTCDNTNVGATGATPSLGRGTFEIV